MFVACSTKFAQNSYCEHRLYVLQSMLQAMNTQGLGHAGRFLKIEIMRVLPPTLCERIIN